MNTSDVFEPSEIDAAEESSGSEYHIDDEEESDSSNTTTLFLSNRSKQSKRPKKRQLAPVGSSTPNPPTFEFIDDDLVEREKTADVRVRRALPVEEPTLAQLMTTILSVKTTLLSAVDKLSKEVEKLSGDVKNRDKQIELLRNQITQHTARTQQTELPSTGATAPRANCTEKASVRWAFQEADKQRGMKLNVAHPVQAEQNKRAVDFAWRSSRVMAPEMSRPSFMCAVKRHMKSKKEQLSRKRHNSETKHLDANRKNSRKFTKSRSRIAALQESNYTKEEVKKLEPALASRYMSSEDSEVDGDGNKVFRVHKRVWEALKLKKLKELTDRIAKASRKTPTVPRVPGAPSTAPPPEDLGELSWIVCTNYGLV